MNYPWINTWRCCGLVSMYQIWLKSDHSLHIHTYIHKHFLSKAQYVFDFWIYIFCLFIFFIQPKYCHGLGSLQFPTGASPCVSQTCIYTGHNLLECPSPSLPLSCYCGQLYLERTDVLREKDRTVGLRLHLYSEGE